MHNTCSYVTVQKYINYFIYVANCFVTTNCWHKLKVHILNIKNNRECILQTINHPEHCPFVILSLLEEATIHNNEYMYVSNNYACQERGTAPSSFSKVFDVVRKLIKILWHWWQINSSVWGTLHIKYCYLGTKFYAKEFQGGLCHDVQYITICQCINTLY